MKSLVWYPHVLGRQAWSVDPEGGCDPLVQAAGVTSLRIAAGGPVRLNSIVST